MANHEHPDQRFERDPFPRMIIVLIIVTVILFLLIAGVMAYDFILRNRTPARPDPAQHDARQLPTTAPALVRVGPCWSVSCRRPAEWNLARNT
ncbi:MAG TPA: hypothetical protein PKI11_11575 [Candidatus Hydrogenedentes bacterium]|nr:hypothetical protein [Candidatus Hydrogenedentota bacterium]HNT86651.1 hypothetical protein [Candidatus Hydrogenedentota bacterium]